MIKTIGRVLEQTFHQRGAKDCKYTQKKDGGHHYWQTRKKI